MLKSSIQCFVACAVMFSAVMAPGQERRLEFKRPELAAHLWAPEDSPIQFRRPPLAAWRSDGTSIPAGELEWLFQSGNLLISQVSAVRSSKLRPLVVVFRVDERAKQPLRLFATALVDDVPLAERNSLVELRRAVSTKDHLFVARISPPPQEAWPASFKIDLRTQAAEPEVLHVLDAAKARECTPEKPLQVEAGVTWYIRPGVRRNEDEQPRSVAVLRVDYKVADQECDWTAEGALTNGSALRLREVRGTRTILEYGSPLPEDGVIARVEIQRRRYRSELYEHVPVRSELLSE